MAVKIHYEDDLYFLQSHIKTLQSGIELEIDTDLFGEKIIEDIFFIDGMLLRLFGTLKENPMVLKRREYLRSLLRTKNTFLEFLERLRDSPFGKSEFTGQYLEKLRACEDSNRSDVQQIRQILQGHHSQAPDEDVVSQEEFRSLLSDEEGSTDAES
jgi:hypothetical protein